MNWKYLSTTNFNGVTVWERITNFIHTWVDDLSLPGLTLLAKEPLVAPFGCGLLIDYANTFCICHKSNLSGWWLHAFQVDFDHCFAFQSFMNSQIFFFNNIDIFFREGDVWWILKLCRSRVSPGCIPCIILRDLQYGAQTSACMQYCASRTSTIVISSYTADIFNVFVQIMGFCECHILGKPPHLCFWFKKYISHTFQ